MRSGLFDLSMQITKRSSQSLRYESRSSERARLKIEKEGHPLKSSWPLHSDTFSSFSNKGDDFLMIPINDKEVQNAIDSFAKQDVYLHLETTNGAYASHFDENFFSAGAYIRNAFVQYEHGKIVWRWTLSGWFKAYHWLGVH